MRTYNKEYQLYVQDDETLTEAIEQYKTQMFSRQVSNLIFKVKWAKLSHVFSKDDITSAGRYLAWRMARQSHKKFLKRNETDYAMWKVINKACKNAKNSIPEIKTHKWYNPARERGGFSYVFPYDNNKHKTQVSEKIWEFLPQIEFWNSAQTFLKIKFDNLHMYFYCGVPVAYEYNNDLICVENYSRQTGIGMILNRIEPNKKKRLSAQKFMNNLLNLCNELKLISPENILENLL